MKKYLNQECPELKDYIQTLKERGIHRTMYNEQARPKNATRIWISYDISEDADHNCRTNLYKWLNNKNAESFGNSVATFLLRGVFFYSNTKVAKWLIKELKEANVLSDEDEGANENTEYLRTRGLSLYIIWRSQNSGDGSAAKRYSDHFVLIQNSKIWHKQGFNTDEE